MTLQDLADSLKDQIKGVHATNALKYVIEAYEIVVASIPYLIHTVASERVEIPLVTNQSHYLMPNTHRMVQVTDVYLNGQSLSCRTLPSLLNESPSMRTMSSATAAIKSCIIVGNSDGHQTILLAAKPSDGAGKFLHVYGSKIPLSISGATIVPELLVSHRSIFELACSMACLAVNDGRSQQFRLSAMEWVKYELDMVATRQQPFRTAQNQDENSRIVSELK